VRRGGTSGAVVANVRRIVSVEGGDEISEDRLPNETGSQIVHGYLTGGGLRIGRADNRAQMTN
jgi:hypothetical protein